jgi:hypothetical protein
MADESRYYKVSAIVDDFIDDNDLTEHWFNKSLKWAIRGLEEIKMDVWQDVKTCLFDVTAVRTVILPPDFVDWVKVGIPYGQYCITMGVNDDLRSDNRSLNRNDLVRGMLSQNMPNGIDFTDYGGYYFFNYNGASVWGIGGGLPSKGYFKLHDKGAFKELLLDYSHAPQKVYVEYITNGFDPCGETVVHPYMKDYLIKFMDFKFEEKNNPKATESSIRRKGTDLYFAEVKVRARFNDLTPKDLINISRKNTRLTPKI